MTGRDRAPLGSAPYPQAEPVGGSGSSESGSSQRAASPARARTSLKTALVHRLARPYVAGPTVADAMRVARVEVAGGAEVTLGRWATPGEAPADVLSANLDALDAVEQAGLPATISIKLPDLDFDRALVVDLLDEARRAGVGVHLDAMYPDTADRTMALLPELLTAHPSLGCTLPGRWSRSVEDARYVTDLGVRSVRVVKGQWADPADPRRDARAGLLAVVDALRHVGEESLPVAGARAGTDTGVEVGVATHDGPLADRALARLVASGTRCRVEQLFGPSRLDVASLQYRFGVRVVVYVPFGAAYLPYALRAALRHPGIAARAGRDLLRAARSPTA